MCITVLEQTLGSLTQIVTILSYCHHLLLIPQEVVGRVHVTMLEIHVNI